MLGDGARRAVLGGRDVAMMRIRAMTGLWWAQLLASVVFAVLAVLTLVESDWIEEVFGVDPDAGSGALEWLIVGASSLIAVVLALLARRTFSAVERVRA